MNKSNKNNKQTLKICFLILRSSKKNVSKKKKKERINKKQNQERTIVSKQWRPSSSRANLGVFCSKPVLLLLAFSFFCVCVCVAAVLEVAVALKGEAIRFFPISSAKRASKALNMEFMMTSKDNKLEQETLKFPEREIDLWNIERCS